MKHTSRLTCVHVCLYIIAYETEHETYQSLFRSCSNGMGFLLSLITGNPVKKNCKLHCNELFEVYMKMFYFLPHAAINHAVTREILTYQIDVSNMFFVKMIYLRSFIPIIVIFSPRSRYSSKRELHGEHVSSRL